jgi:hypothetical protein
VSQDASFWRVRNPRSLGLVSWEQILTFVFYRFIKEVLQHNVRNQVEEQCGKREEAKKDPVLLKNVTFSLMIRETSRG